MFVCLQAEMELRISQSLFNHQSEITRQLVEGINNIHVCIYNIYEVGVCTCVCVCVIYKVQNLYYSAQREGYC